MDSQRFEVVIYERVFLSFSVLITLFVLLIKYIIATDSRGRFLLVRGASRERSQSKSRSGQILCIIQLKG